MSEQDKLRNHLEEMSGMALKLRARLNAVLAGQPDPYPDMDEPEIRTWGTLSRDKTAPHRTGDKIQSLRREIENLQVELERLRVALEEIATRTTRELAAHSARIARATLDGEDWR